MPDYENRRPSRRLSGLLERDLTAGRGTGARVAPVGWATLSLFALLPTIARPQEIVDLDPNKDNSLYESSSGDVSNGQGEYLFVAKTEEKGPNNPSELRRAVIAFDPAASIPAGSTITAVSLTLTVSKVRGTSPRALELHRLTTDWGEGTSDAPNEEGEGAPATVGDATWLHTFFDTDFWASAGGDYDGSASAATDVGAEGTYTWASALMAQDVQGWLDNPANSFGWIVIGDESEEGTAKRLNSRENDDVPSRPVLTVTYTPPAATGACCASDGSCAVLSSGECSPPDDYQGDGTGCTPNPCPQPVGACCFDDGSCVDLSVVDCAAGGGTYQGDGTDCSTASCTPVIGACCLPEHHGGCASQASADQCLPQQTGSCEALSSSQCSAQGGLFQGNGTDCQVELCPFADPLPIPAVVTPLSGTPGGAATYDIAMTELEQQLHRDLPATTVWGYGGTYPGPTIEARRDFPVTVRWINDLRDDEGLRSSHYLPVDPCMHGPDTEGDAPRTVVHLHGGHVPAAVDGYPEDTFLPGEQVEYVYPNNQDAATLWYHDHALGITRLNVYMGLAGFYLLRDDIEDALELPANEYEIPVVIQDRALSSDGSLSYPALWQGHFFGDKILVNGKVWPYLEVKQGKYRLRMLNGSNSRVYTLTFDDGSPAGAPFFQIGTEGGLLPAPVELTELTLAPGERADLVVDFAGHDAGTEILLTNSARAPFPNGPAESVVPQVMKFIVLGQAGHTAALPDTLRPLEVLDEDDALQERQLVLTKESEPCAGIWWLINGLGWDDITEAPVLGTTEIWSFVNQTGVVHPMHMHLVLFQVLDRQPFEVVGEDIVPIGEPMLPDPEEAGWKDTVQAMPGEITRVIARFDDYTGLYPYHCHILEHEDHEMMRQFEVLGGTIVLEKQTVPDGEATLFTFTGDVAGSLQDGERLVVEPLPPDTYQSIEQVPNGWELTSIVCDDADSGGDVGTATATFRLSVSDVAARQPATCVFTNCILELALSDQTVTGTKVFESCDSISASNFTVASDPGGTDISFRTERLIVLGNQFTVESDAVFTAEIE
jgi:spore coat protein A